MLARKESIVIIVMDVVAQVEIHAAFLECFVAEARHEMFEGLDGSHDELMGLDDLRNSTPMASCLQYIERGVPN